MELLDQGSCPQTGNLSAPRAGSTDSVATAARKDTPTALSFGASLPLVMCLNMADSEWL